MANPNFNKQVAPARKKLAEGGPSSDTGKRGGMGLMGPRIKDMMKRPKDSPLKRGPKGEPVPGNKMEPIRRMPKLPGKTRPGPMKGLTPEQIKRLKELMQKTGRPRPKKGSVTDKALKASDPKMQKMQKMQKRKKLMGGGSSSSREAMMHGFYNKDMGMGKKKK